MRKVIGLTLLCFFFILPAAVFAQEKTYEVSSTVSALMVREEPASNSDIIGKLKAGDKVKVFKEEHGWFQTYFNGQQGWVASHYLYASSESSSSESSASEVSNNQEVTIQADGTRIRTGPETSYRIQTMASNGDTFPMVETQNDWVQISLPDGSTGWVAGWLTNEGGQAAPASDTTQAETPQVNSSNTAANGDLSGYNIVIDPGHGGHDPGAVGLHGVQEKDLIMRAINPIVSELEKAGANVILTRSDDRFVSLEDRVKISHSYNTDAFISIHLNTNPLTVINGISTHYYNNNSKSLAYTMQESLGSQLNLANRGVMYDGLYVLRNNNHPALLLELGFITNANDLSVIQSESYPADAAKGITNGLIRYFNQ